MSSMLECMAGMSDIEIAQALIDLGRICRESSQSKPNNGIPPLPVSAIRPVVSAVGDNDVGNSHAVTESPFPVRETPISSQALVNVLSTAIHGSTSNDPVSRQPSIQVSEMPVLANGSTSCIDSVSTTSVSESCSSCSLFRCGDGATNKQAVSSDATFAKPGSDGHNTACQNTVGFRYSQSCSVQPRRDPSTEKSELDQIRRQQPVRRSQSLHTDQLRVSFEDDRKFCTPDVSTEVRALSRSPLPCQQGNVNVVTAGQPGPVVHLVDAEISRSSRRRSSGSSRSPRRSNGSDPKLPSENRRSARSTERRHSSRHGDGGDSRSRSRGRSTSKSSRRSTSGHSRSRDRDDAHTDRRCRPSRQRNNGGDDDGDDPDDNDDPGDDSSSDDNDDSRKVLRRHSKSPDGTGRSPARSCRTGTAAKGRQLSVKPDHFDGSGCFQTFMCLFENSADYNG